MSTLGGTYNSDRLLKKPSVEIFEEEKHRKYLLSDTNEERSISRFVGTFCYFLDLKIFLSIMLKHSIFLQ
jgi:hypothetical protein